MCGPCGMSEMCKDCTQNPNAEEYGMTKEEQLQKDLELQAEAIGYYRKRIAELEMTVGTLRNFSNEQATCIERLEKENAELKGLKDVAALIRANNDTVVTLMQLNNMLVSKSQQLTKAKIVLRNVIDYLGQFCSDYPDCVIEAEQFLKDSEVEK